MFRGPKDDRGQHTRPGPLPDRLFALTPHQIAALFYRPPPGPDPDRVEEVAGANRDRAAEGLGPVAPSWLLPQLRR